MTIYDETRDYYEGSIQEAIRQTVLRCAQICDDRASVDGKHMSIAAEARKCADSIRHFLLCEDGEHICYTCNGDGCHKCEGTGIVGANQPARKQDECVCDKLLCEDHHPQCPARP